MIVMLVGLVSALAAMCWLCVAQTMSNRNLPAVLRIAAYVHAIGVAAIGAGVIENLTPYEIANTKLADGRHQLMMYNAIAMIWGIIMTLYIVEQYPARVKKCS